MFRWKGDSFNKYLTSNPNYHFDSIEVGDFDAAKGCHVSVDVYDLVTLNYIITYDSFVECAEALNINKNSISDVCNGRTNSINGYVFRHKGASLDEFGKLPRPHRIPINKYTKDGKYVCTYESVLEAVRKLNLKGTGTGISNCVRGKQKTAYGFLWYRQNDLNQPDKTKIVERIENENARKAI